MTSTTSCSAVQEEEGRAPEDGGASELLPQEVAGEDEAHSQVQEAAGAAQDGDSESAQADLGHAGQPNPPAGKLQDHGVRPEQHHLHDHVVQAPHDA